MKALAPRVVAAELAAFYRAHPERWRQFRSGNLKVGCCVSGGAIDLLGRRRQLASYCAFIVAFEKVVGQSTVGFNDKAGQTVENVIAALERVQ